MVSIPDLPRFSSRPSTTRILPLARMNWSGPSRAVIHAQMTRGQVLSVQVTYNPAWHAWLDGHRVKVRKDGLGLIVIEPDCEGHCEVNLSYGATPEIWFCRVMSALVAAALVTMLLAFQGFHRRASALIGG